MPPTNIVIVTITARPDPEARLPDMARTLAYMAEGLHPRAGVTWLVVDELERDLSATLPPTGRLSVVRVRPKPSRYRPALPDHNGARNTALASILLPGGPDYVVFLDDQTVVTRSFGEVVLAAAQRGTGLRAAIKFLRDVAVPPDGEIDVHESGGLDFTACGATSVAGGCFGAPTKKLLEVDGFDEAYSGQYGREDVECFVRLERAGLKWETCKRASALQLGTGAPGSAADRGSITADRDALQGKRNKVMFKKLQGDRRRTTPEIGLGALGGWVPSWEVVRERDIKLESFKLDRPLIDVSKLPLVGETKVVDITGPAEVTAMGRAVFGDTVTLPPSVYDLKLIDAHGTDIGVKLVPDCEGVGMNPAASDQPTIDLDDLLDDA